VQRLLALESTPASDEADALAVAICHGLSLRSPARLALRALGART
jgi:Holliday junction resolvasome RuvABC endonuclease subunit